MPEAPLERTEHGLVPTAEGWFVVNVRDARWIESDGLGIYASFNSEKARFPELGINVSVLRPGEPMCMYHAEETQEAFLVLAGQCLLLVEGQERPLRTWDFFHCPPWTKHVLVGAGDGPCLVLATGARREGKGLLYPVDEIALKHGAGVETETRDPREAYAPFGDDKAGPFPAEFPGLAS